MTITFAFQSESPEEVLTAVGTRIDEVLAGFGSARSTRVEKLKERRCTVHLGEFLPGDVLPFISRSNIKRPYRVGDKEYAVRMNSHRYFIFRESLACAACGLVGTKMILEQNSTDTSPHFNLYGEEDGLLVLMTKDHVQPKAFGGVDRHSNYQTMCCICNNLKGAEALTLNEIRKLREVFNANRLLPKRQLRKLLDDEKSLLLSRRPPEPVWKVEKPANAAATDLHVWRLSDGQLIGRSIYEADIDGGVPVACIRHGSSLDLVEPANGRVRLSDTETFTVPLGLIENGDKA